MKTKKSFLWLAILLLATILDTSPGEINKTDLTTLAMRLCLRHSI